jgi:hypothetical protein
MRATCLPRLILLDVITLTIFGEAEFDMHAAWSLHIKGAWLPHRSDYPPPQGLKLILLYHSPLLLNGTVSKLIKLYFLSSQSWVLNYDKSSDVTDFISLLQVAQWSP